MRIYFRSPIKNNEKSVDTTIRLNGVEVPVKQLFGSIILLGALCGIFPASWGQTSLENPNQQKSTFPFQSKTKREQAFLKLHEAKRLIVDALPEDRNLAENSLIEAARLAPQEPEVYAELARFTLWQIANGIKDPAELHHAAAMATHVKELAPQRPLGDFLQCEILLAMGQFQQGMALYLATLKRFPDHTDSKAFEARYWSDSNPRRSLEAAQIVLSRNHDMDDLSPAIALALKNAAPKNRVGETIANFAAVHPDRWLWHRAGMAFLEEGQNTRARDAFLIAIQLGNILESRLQLGVLSYTLLAKPVEAIFHLGQLKTELLKHNGIRTETVSLAEGHLALAYFSAGQTKSGLEAGHSALSLAGDNQRLVVGFFEEFKKIKKEQYFIADIAKIAIEFPAMEYTHITLGNVAIEKKDYESANVHFVNAITLNPERDDLYAAKGNIAYKRNRFDDALKDFETAAQLKPDQPSHHYNKACMLALLGRKQEAMNGLRIAIGLSDELMRAAQTDVDLEDLRKDNNFRAQLVTLGVLAPENPSPFPARNVEQDVIDSSVLSGLRPAGTAVDK